MCDDFCLRPHNSFIPTDHVLYSKVLYPLYTHPLNHSRNLWQVPSSFRCNDARPLGVKEGALSACCPLGSPRPETEPRVFDPSEWEQPSPPRACACPLSHSMACPPPRVPSIPSWQPSSDPNAASFCPLPASNLLIPTHAGTNIPCCLPTCRILRPARPAQCTQPGCTTHSPPAQQRARRHDLQGGACALSCVLCPPRPSTAADPCFPAESHKSLDLWPALRRRAHTLLMSVLALFSFPPPHLSRDVSVRLSLPSRTLGARGRVGNNREPVAVRGSPILSMQRACSFKTKFEWTSFGLQRLPRDSES